MSRLDEREWLLLVIGSIGIGTQVFGYLTAGKADAALVGGFSTMILVALGFRLDRGANKG